MKSKYPVLQRSVPLKNAFKYKSGAKSINIYKGFTLIELIVSLAIGILILGSVLLIFINSGRATRAAEYQTKMNEEAFIVLNILQQQIRLAGYSRFISNTPDATTGSRMNLNSSFIKGCDNGFVDPKAAFDSLTCAPSNPTGGNNSSIAIRYEADFSNTIPTAGTTPAPTNCLMAGIAQDAPSGLAGAPAYYLADNRFYINRLAANSVCPQPRPQLYCTGATQQTPLRMVGPQPIIPNVEQMVFRYGVSRISPFQETASTTIPEDEKQYLTNSSQIVSYLTANELETTTAFAGETSLQRWQHVRSIKACVLIRSDVEIDKPNPLLLAYRDCNGNMVNNTTDRYIRRAYVTTTQLRAMTVPILDRNI